MLFILFILISLFFLVYICPNSVTFFKNFEIDGNVIIDDVINCQFLLGKLYWVGFVALCNFDSNHVWVTAHLQLDMTKQMNAFRTNIYGLLTNFLPVWQFLDRSREVLRRTFEFALPMSAIEQTCSKYERNLQHLIETVILIKKLDWSGIRTHAPEEIGALIQRLRPLGHPVLNRSQIFFFKFTMIMKIIY